MLLPTTSARAPLSAQGTSRSFSSEYIGEQGTGQRVFAPIFISSKNVDIPSYFIQSKRGKGNNVLHAKSAGCVLKGSLYDYYLGRASTTYSNVGRTRYWCHDYHNGISYIIRVMSYRQNLAIMTSVELSVTKYEKREQQRVTSLSCDATLAMITRSNDHYISNLSYHGFTQRDIEWIKIAVLSLHPDYNNLREKELANEIFDTLIDYPYALSQSRRFQFPVQEIESVTPQTSSDLGTAFLIGEQEYVLDGYAVGPNTYWLEALQQGAFMSMIDNMPTLNDNSLSNIAGLCSLLKSIIIDHKPKIPSSLSDAWLAYRYSYNTTKLDINEAIRFAKRVSDGALGRDLQLFGVSSIEYRGVSMTCRCTGILSQKELDLLSKITNSLFQYGLSPSFYVIWDMIPYSFIVDWFIPVGDILHEQDNFLMYTRNYEFREIWYSISYDSFAGEIPAHVYTRWAGQVPSCYHGYYSLENKGTMSDKVLGFRILDALSLVFR